ncbi:MAG: hypothetical protein PVH52_00950 [bacterium]|jgi:hypothetical protein
MVSNGSRIAILAAFDPSEGGPGAARRALAGISSGVLPPGTVILEHNGTILKALEAAADFDGLVLVDGASMGMRPGGAAIFTLNELILPGSPPRVVFDNVDVESDILYASKFLSLPPLRIVGIQPDETRAGEAQAGCGAGEAGTGGEGSFLDTIRRAIFELTRE